MHLDLDILTTPPQYFSLARFYLILPGQFFAAVKIWHISRSLSVMNISLTNPFISLNWGRIYSGEVAFISYENTCMKIEKLTLEMKVKEIVSCACLSILMWSADYRLPAQFRPPLSSINDWSSPVLLQSALLGCSLRHKGLRANTIRCKVECFFHYFQLIKSPFKK